MTPFGRIVGQAGWVLAGRIGGQAMAVGLTVLLAARLGPAGLGGYAVIAAVIYVANVVTTFGTDMVLIREVAADERDDGWAAALGVQLVLSAGAIGLLWLVSGLFGADRAETGTALRIYSLSLLPAAVSSVVSAMLRGKIRLARLTAIGTLGAALQLGAAWWFVTPEGGLVTAAGVLLGAQVVAGIVAWVIAAGSDAALRRAPVATPRDVLRMLRRSAPVGALGMVGVLYQRLAVIGLSVAAGPAVTAWFATASKVVEASKTGHVALYTALYPAMAETHARPGGDRASGRVLERSTWLAGGLAAVVTLGLAWLGPAVIWLLFGPAFAPASAAVVVLGLSVLPSTFATYLSLELVAARREDITLRALILSLVTLAALLAGLVPLVGWIGACWAVVGAESVQAVCLIVARRRLLGPAAIASRAPRQRHALLEIVP